MAQEYPLSLVIKAVDKATAPIRAINKRMAEITAPVRKLNNSLRALSAEAGVPRLVKSFRGVGTAVAGVGSATLALGAKMAGLAAVAGFGFYRVVRGAVDAGDKLGEMAQRVGLSVDAYAQLQFAAAQADVEQEAFNGAMDQFNKRLGMAKAGSGELLTFLKKVSPALALQVQGAKSTEEALALMAAAFEKVQDPGKRAALAAAAFGRSGLQMGQFLGQGNKALAEQRRRFFELVGSQKRFAEGAGELDNAMRETGMAFGALRNRALAELFPALTKLARALTELLARNGDRLVAWAQQASAAISKWVDSGGLGRLVAAIERWGSSIGKVVDALGGLKGVLAVLGLVTIAPLLASVGSLAGALFNLGGAVLPMVVRVGAMVGPALAGIAPALGSALLAAGPLAAALTGIVASMYLIYRYRDVLHPEVNNEATFFGRKLLPDGERRILGANGQLLKVPKAQSSEAHVTVDFNGLPKGARASVATDSSAPLDLNLGYSMGGG